MAVHVTAKCRQEDIDLVSRYVLVFDHIAVGTKLVRVEEVAPPVGLDVALKVFHGAEHFCYLCFFAFRYSRHYGILA